MTESSPKENGFELSIRNDCRESSVSRVRADLLIAVCQSKLGYALNSCAAHRLSEGIMSVLAFEYDQ